MLDIENRTYTINGTAMNFDILFRIRNEIVTHSIDEMFMKGYLPYQTDPEIGWQVDKYGHIDYSFTWSVYPV